MYSHSPLYPEKYYHIYNRGINGEDIFNSENNYIHFLELYKNYVEPIAKTFAYCLLKNHFHLLIQIKTEAEQQQFYNNQKAKNLTSFIEFKILESSKQFSHLFNSYTQSFNKQTQRTGGLFETPFKRKLIDDENYLKQLVFYIHNNPVKHGFTESLQSYRWSSYNSVLSDKSTLLKKEEVLSWFSGKDHFIEFHKRTNNDLPSDLTIEK